MKDIFVKENTHFCKAENAITSWRVMCLLQKRLGKSEEINAEKGLFT